MSTELAAVYKFTVLNMNCSVKVRQCSVIWYDGNIGCRPHISLVDEEAGWSCGIKSLISRSVSSGRHLQRLDMALLRSGVSISLFLMLCAHFFLSSAGKWRAAWWSLLLPFPLPLLLLLLLLLLLVLLLLAILPSLTPLSHHSSRLL